MGPDAALVYIPANPGKPVAACEIEI